LVRLVDIRYCDDSSGHVILTIYFLLAQQIVSMKEDLVKFIRNLIFVGNSPSKIHVKHPLLGAHGLCSNGLPIMRHIDRTDYLLHGVTAKDEQTREKFNSIVGKLDRSGDRLKQAKPNDEEKWNGIASSWLITFNFWH